MNDLLRNAIILDTETTSLRRGAGIHELATFDVASNQFSEFIVKPNLVSVTPYTPQDVTKLVSSSKDIHKRVPVGTWQEAISKELFTQLGLKGNAQADIESLRWQNPFLYKALKSGTYPQLSNMPQSNESREALLRSFGIKGTFNQSASIEDVIESLKGTLAGKTVWIANAVFESKQIGAQVAAMRESGVDTGLKSILETQNVYSPDPFYVTGVEVNKARAAAQITGDWSNVWKAYVRNPPKAGETAVRDIQDVLRSMMSYGRSMGLFNGGNTYFGTGIDVAHSLFARAEGNVQRAGLSEVHRAVEDAAIHESYVLRKGIEYTTALQQVSENGVSAKFYRDLAARGAGPLAEATKYFSMLEGIAPDLQRMNLIKRLHRSYEDISRTGETHQVIGPGNLFNMKQVTPSGEEALVPRVDYRTQRFTSLDEVGKFLEQSGDYSHFANVPEEVTRFKTAATSLEAAGLYADTQVEAIRRTMMSRAVPSVSRLSALPAISEVAETSMRALGRINPRAVLAGAAFMTGLGAAMSVVQSKPKDQSSILGFNYYDWLKAQEGMVNTGLAKENRSKNTDFGSPYQGPVVSNQVFVDQKLLAEREKYLRAQYGVSHYDPQKGLFGAFGVFSAFNQGGYSYLHEGTRVESGYQGLKGNNLVSLNLNEGWKISVEDADTITVRKGGVRGAISSFFGLNRGYSIRLAGIDSPEISHSDRKAQPYADQARDALQSLIDKGQKAEVVFTTSDTSYGRMMGALLVDDTNLNYEMIKRGYVAHLPYGKSQNAIVNYNSMKRAETMAYSSGRGLWSTPWAQAFYEATEGKDRPTFNTLANSSKVVSSTGQMSLVSLMNQADSAGSFSDFHRGAAHDVGRYLGRKESVQPIYYDAPVSGSQEVMADLMMDTSEFVKTHGGRTRNKFSRRGNYGKLDTTMAIDSLGTTNSVWTRRRYGAFEQYRASEAIRNERQQRMAESQRDLNQTLFLSPIGHHRM